ncbi:unnamed protein product [Didymodactylos carnosus]|uniref:Uncharacterized protein n=1 Tax=Didymodactylos carnosus TaxID=1234261 RepID=A0A813YUR9_9BILA|nr:unnamed protein product [Didymodactylos carnosus]CAF1144668.1 unnamed protein product [Didymodactylos carnosus]CAF3673983.1 unnamed protein product [Didymodactylos carnosus]CAF3944891.1 unnamed protein product [Didymodactylos carnosus]
MESLDIWTFGDQYRATVKAQSSNDRSFLTGMALCLNSQLQITEGAKKLSPVPILLMSNSEGILQTYYFLNQMPSICKIPESFPIINKNTDQNRQQTFSTLTSIAPPFQTLSSFMENSK